MRRFLKWTAIVVVILAIVGFVSFLYLIPPFTLIAPETFAKMQLDVMPPMQGITDPATRAIAERGRYLVLTSDCAGCHMPPGPDNAVPQMYMAGGMRFLTTSHGEVVSRNLTPDKETGIGARTDDELKRALRGGVRGGAGRSGWSMPHTSMPWPVTTNWSEEDMYAVITYLRHIPPVRHAIPAPKPGRPDNPLAFEAAYGGQDAGHR